MHQARGLHRPLDPKAVCHPLLRKAESLDQMKFLNKKLLHMLQCIFPDYLQLEASKAVASNCAQDQRGDLRAAGVAILTLQSTHLLLPVQAAP